VFFASLACNYFGQIDLRTGAATVLEPPCPAKAHRASGATAHSAESHWCMPIRWWSRHWWRPATGATAPPL